VPETIEAGEHDRLLAWTSHLPQAASTALARALGRAGVHLDRLGPGGRDMTRLAHSSADIWTPTALDNAASLSRALACLESELAALREALEREDGQAVREFFDLRVGERRPDST
ncbi:MAG: prephenate dehydrogenase dimerization domain-containing protein, partial [Longimicrobiales bacterium]